MTASPLSLPSDQEKEMERMKSVCASAFLSPSFLSASQ